MHEHIILILNEQAWLIKDLFVCLSKMVDCLQISLHLGGEQYNSSDKTSNKRKGAILVLDYHPK